MKTPVQRYVILSFMFFLLFSMSSCAAIGDIFKAGAWTGALFVIVGIALVIWLISKLFGGGGNSNT
ncbi:hypothetical protein J2I47_20950 [Fibrella sp. HMF5335]|uniref:Phosphatidate cytidylyltransferase n=1 Tax=Fibrella rubiginis TaxID=2817060 RepID=A0A939GKD9_9BACT|nr:hypothetical protein [Fibrella rubiginis]MBO0939035.1 hypothetical protein [Fibrella rubiginis]